MEKENIHQEKQNDEAIIACSTLQFPLSDETAEDRIYTTSQTNISKTLTSNMAAVQNKFKLDKTKQGTDESIRKLHNQKGEFKKSGAEQKFNLHQQNTTQTGSLKETSINSPNQKKSKSSRKSKAVSQKNVAQGKSKICNLQTLIANEETREDGLFYSLIAEKDITSFLSGDPSSLNATLISAKPKAELTRTERHKSSSGLNRTFNLSDLSRKPEMDRTSQNETKSGNAPSIISRLLTSLQEMKLTEPKVHKNENINKNSDVPIEIGISLSDKSYEEIESYFSLFKRSKVVPSSRDSSDSGTLTPDSIDLDSNTNSSISLKRSKPTELSAKTQFEMVSAKSNSSKILSESELCEPDMQSKLISSPLGKRHSCGRSDSQKAYGKSKPTYLYTESGLYDQSKVLDPSVRPKVADLSARPAVSDSSAKIIRPDPSTKRKISTPSLRLKLPELSLRPKVSDPSVRPKQSDPSLRHKVPDPIAGPKVIDPSVKPKITNSTVLKFSDISMRKKTAKLSSRSKFHGSLLKTTLVEEREDIDENATGSIRNSNQDSNNCMTDLKLEQYVISRRLSFTEMRQAAESVQVFMNKTAVLKPEYQADVKVTNSRRMRSSASDWLNLVFYWDLVRKEVNVIVETIDTLYVSGNISMSSEEFNYFMRQLLKAFKDILNLICLSQNGFTRYTKLCSSHDMYIFLSHVTTFESRVLPLFKKLRYESEQFTEYKKQQNN